MFSDRLKNMRKSFGLQLTAWIILLLCITHLLDFTISRRVISSALQSHDEQEILDELDEYSAAYRAAGLTGVSKKSEYEYRANGSLLLVVRLVNSQGNLLFSNATAEFAPFDLQSLSRRPVEDGKVVVLGGKTATAKLEVVRRRFDDGNELQIADTTEDRDEILATVDRLFGLTFLPILLLTGVGGLFLAHRALIPVRHLLALLQSILRTGQLTARAPLRGSGDELDSLSSLFNSLLERISVLVETMKYSLDNVAHDLRTPMARFRGNAELALRETDPVPVRESLLNAIEESDRILTTLHTLMDISEAEAGTMELNIESIELRALVERVISLYEFVADEKQIQVRQNIPSGLTVDVDIDRMTQALANLLDNALKYTEARGSVDFIATETTNEIELSVADSGVGIRHEDMPHIFERLYRGDKSRSSRGFGLGLSLVKAIVRAHKTSIHVTSLPNQGSTFRIMLPRKPNR
jgi:signal transduction histidine kinase